jgi:hypothetical protein
MAMTVMILGTGIATAFNTSEVLLPDMSKWDPASPSFLPRVPNTLPQNQPVMLFQESFENASDEIIATPENNPAPTVGGGYVMIGHGIRADDGSDVFARRKFGDAGVNVRTNENMDGEWLLASRDHDNAPGSRGDAFPGENLTNRGVRVKWLFDVAGFGNLSLKMVICGGGDDSRFGHEPNDDFKIRVRFDGGEWYAVGGFKGTATNTVPKYYQGPVDTVTNRMDRNGLTRWFEEWEWPIAGHGGVMEVQFTIDTNSPAEDFYIDNVRLYGDSTAELFTATFAQQNVVEPESGGVVNPLTITLAQPAPDGGLTLKIASADGRTARGFQHPEAVVIAAGLTTVEVPVEIVQDGQYTGPKTVDLYVTAPNHTEYARVTIEDVTQKPKLLVTEIMMIVPGFSGSTKNADSGDTNNDGVFHRIIDQFVEIVNIEDYPVDISFYRTGDDLADNHIFPEGTILHPLQAVVVFADGNPRGTFGGAIVQVSTGGGLGYEVSSRADWAYLDSSFHAPIDLVHSPMLTADHLAWAAANHPADHPYKGQSSSGHRLSLEWTEPGYSFTQDSGTIHSMIPGADYRLFSPGVNFNGQPFFTVENEITLTVDNGEFPEDAGNNAATGTINLASPAPAGGMEINLEVRVNEQGSIVPLEKIKLSPQSVFIGGGQSSASFSISAVHVPFIDGDKLVDIYARAVDMPYVLPGWAELTVLDVEDDDYNIIFNELFTDVVGSAFDTNMDGLFEDIRGDQFIEFVNMSGRPVNMSGWTLWWEGRHDWSFPFQAHTFPEGSWVPDGGAVLIFGRVPPNPTHPDFGGALVQGALSPDGNTPSPYGLNFGINESFLFTLVTPHGHRVFTTDRWNPDVPSGKSNQDQSVTRNPDLEGGFDLHFNASLAIGGFDNTSPGVRINKTPFAGSGAFLTPHAFNRATEIVMGQWFADPMFGYLGMVAINRVDLPWLYSAKRAAFWSVHPGVNNGIWVYDMALQSWLYAHYTNYPHVWKLDASGGAWVNINDL